MGLRYFYPFEIEGIGVPGLTVQYWLNATHVGFALTKATTTGWMGINVYWIPPPPSTYAMEMNGDANVAYLDASGNPVVCDLHMNNRTNLGIDGIVPLIDTVSELTLVGATINGSYTTIEWIRPLNATNYQQDENIIPGQPQTYCFAYRSYPFNPSTECSLSGAFHNAGEALLANYSFGTSCPNNCSGNGVCVRFQGCQCQPNWAGADCSLGRITFLL